MNKPQRHIWEEGSTHRSVAGKEYDEVWDYAEALEAENKRLIDFVIWLSPCGQNSNPPAYELIGEKARALLAEL